jgi:hypothetical protein
MSSASRDSSDRAADRGLHEFLARHGLEGARSITFDELNRVPGETGLGTVLVRDIPWSVDFERLCCKTAAALADRGRFAFVLHRASRPASSERPRHNAHSRCADPITSRWHTICATLFRSGLWVDGHLLRRNVPLFRRRLVLPTGNLLPFADNATIVGVRLVRDFEAQQNSLLAKLRNDGTATTVCAGSSMAPTFDVGDRLTFAPHTSPRSGEIVLMIGQANLLVHRVLTAVGQEDTGWVVHRGDAPGATPGFAAKWRVVGRLVNVERVC